MYVSTTQFENSTIKYDVLVIWYSRLPTNRYRTQKKSTVELPLLLLVLLLLLFKFKEEEEGKKKKKKT